MRSLGIGDPAERRNIARISRAPTHILVGPQPADFMSALALRTKALVERCRGVCFIHEDARSLIRGIGFRPASIITVLDPIGLPLKGRNILSVGIRDLAARAHVSIDDEDSFAEFESHIDWPRFGSIMVLTSGNSGDFRNPILSRIVSTATRRGISASCAKVGPHLASWSGSTLYVLTTNRLAEDMAKNVRPLESLPASQVVCACPVDIVMGLRHPFLAPVIDIDALAWRVLLALDTALANPSPFRSIDKATNRTTTTVFTDGIPPI